MAPVLPDRKVAHLGTAGDCCTAGFQSWLCPIWVKTGGSNRRQAPTHVRNAPKSRHALLLPPLALGERRHRGFETARCAQHAARHLSNQRVKHSRRGVESRQCKRFLPSRWCIMHRAFSALTIPVARRCDASHSRCGGSQRVLLGSGHTFPRGHGLRPWRVPRRFWPRLEKLKSACNARFYWRARRDSNPRPPDSKSGALSS